MLCLEMISLLEKVPHLALMSNRSTLANPKVPKTRKILNRKAPKATNIHQHHGRLLQKLLPSIQTFSHHQIHALQHKSHSLLQHILQNLQSHCGLPILSIQRKVGKRARKAHGITTTLEKARGCPCPKARGKEKGKGKERGFRFRQLRRLSGHQQQIPRLPPRRKVRRFHLNHQLLPPHKHPRLLPRLRIRRCHSPLLLRPDQLLLAQQSDPRQYHLRISQAHLPHPAKHPRQCLPLQHLLFNQQLLSRLLYSQQKAPLFPLHQRNLLTSQLSVLQRAVPPSRQPYHQDLPASLLPRTHQPYLFQSEWYLLHHSSPPTSL